MAQMLFDEEKLTERPVWYAFGKIWHIPIFERRWPRWVKHGFIY
jgi:hypothetical protein